MPKAKVNISANIPAELNDKIEDCRWNERINTRAEIVEAALTEWVERRGTVLQFKGDERMVGED